MRIGIASPFNPNEFKDYLQNEKLPDINQSARAIHIYVRELLEAGHKVVIFTSFTSSVEKRSRIFSNGNLKVYVISRHYLIPKVGAFIRLFLHKRIAKAIKGEVKNLDVLHAQWTYEYALAASKFVKQIPIFCTVRDWCPAIMRGQKRIIDKIYWACSYYTFRKVIVNERIHFIANSSYTYDRIKSIFSRREVTLIYNPVCKKEIRLQRDYYPDNPKFVSIANGSGKLKNIKTLVESFHLFKGMNTSAELLLIGPTFLKDNAEVQDWNNRGLLNGVILKGLRSHEEIIKILDTCSAMIHPSLEETFGNVLVEGMSRRIPVVGGENSGAVPEVLGYGKNGILCDVNNPKDICMAMEESINQEVRRTLTENATTTLINIYSSDAIVKEHINLYKKFIKTNDLNRF